jgi:iron complex outermembrane recepter protein
MPILSLDTSVKPLIISAKLILLTAVYCSPPVLHAQARADITRAEVMEQEVIEVIGTTPLPGLGTPLSKVPSNAQVFSAKDMAKQRANNLVDFLESNPNGVSVNAAQGNPYQTDINFRGFTASPLLGTPQGLSVFLDGVRVNEPFGDVVNWDLIPQFALSGIQVIPGSNPTFGLNTLGGAVGLYTKSGSSFPGTTLELSAGSFGRNTFELQTGGKLGEAVDYYLGANISKDRGWAQENASNVKQMFGKVGWQNDSTDIDTTLLLIDNTLRGTQTLPASFLDQYFTPYTYPDINRNQLTHLAVKGSHFVNKSSLLGGDVYYRRYRSNTFASNINDQFDIATPQLQAINDRASVEQDSYGAGLQLTLDNTLGSMKNQTVLGASVDANRVRYVQEQQDATFSATRESIGIDDFVQTVDAKTSGQSAGLYVNNVTEISPQFTLTLSARYNRSTVQIRDQTGNAPDLNGDHVFTKLNPAIGLNYNPNANTTAYATANQGMRSPTAIELTCADPTSPCRLPNSFLADPPLKAVISRTMEIGARGKFGEAVKGKAQSSWSAALFRTQLTHDIAFISSGSGLNAGYFANVGNTQRQGLELAMTHVSDAVKMSARYSHVQATFRTSYVSHSPSNDTADANGDIVVNAGNVMPSIAPHTLKLRLDYAPFDTVSAGISASYASAMYPRGNENNADSRGKVPGYTVINLDARYSLTKQLQLFARVNNLLDKRYSNFGVLGQNYFTGPGRSFGPLAGIPVQPTEQFRGLGAPRGIWLGVNYALDEAAARRRDD